MAPTIRLATEDDAEQIREIYAPFCRDTPVSFETQPPTVDEMRQRIAKILEVSPVARLRRRRADPGIRLRQPAPRTRRVSSGRSMSRSMSAKGRRRGGRGPCPLYLALRALAAPGLLQRPRRHHLAQPGQRRPSPVDGLPDRRRLSEHRLQVRGLARRRLVAAHLAGSRPRTQAARDCLIVRESPEWHDALQAGLGSSRVSRDREKSHSSRQPWNSAVPECRRGGCGPP